MKRRRARRRSSGSTSAGTSSAGSGSSRRPRSRRSTTSRSPSTAARSSRCSCSRRRAASTSRRSRPRARTPSSGCTSTRSKASSRGTPGGWSTTRESTTPGEQKQIAAIVGRLYEAFVQFDAMLCEINPLIVTPGGEVKALDSKFTVDDNALFRHPDIAEMRDPEAYPPEERAAREKGVTYVKLDGEIGILGNGAGLVMSTLDVIALAGGRAANFCDLGGGGDAQGVVDALEIITGDPQVKAILFNVFGGITRCDEVARGILQALDRMTIAPPDRRAARRDERRGGAAAAGRGRAAEPARRADDARRGEAGRGAGEMTDVWSRARRGLPPERRAPRGAGPRPDRRVGCRGGDGARRRHRRRPRRPAAARGRAEGGHDRRRARHAARRRLPRRGAPVCRRELRRRRVPAAAPTTSRTCAPRSARWRASPRGR